MGGPELLFDVSRLGDCQAANRVSRSRETILSDAEINSDFATNSLLTYILGTRRVRHSKSQPGELYDGTDGTELDTNKYTRPLGMYLISTSTITRDLKYNVHI